MPSIHRVTRPDTRTRLLNAAVRVIDKGGESALNVHKVALEAGVTVPSLYHFFGSREGLVEEAQVARFEKGMQVVGLSLDETLAGITTARKYKETLRKWLHSLLGGPNSRFRRTRATVIASAVNNPSLAARIADIQEQHVRRISTYLNYGRSKGWVDDDLDIEAISLWTTTQLNGRVVLELDPKQRYIREWDKLFVESVMHTLRYD